MRSSSWRFRTRQAARLSCSLVISALFCVDSGAQLGEALIDFLFELLVLGGLLRAYLLEVFLEHPLEGVEGAIALHGVLDDLRDLHAGGVERHPHRPLADVGRQLHDVLAAQHLRDLEHGVAVRRRGDLGRGVDFREVGWSRHRRLERCIGLNVRNQIRGTRRSRRRPGGRLLRRRGRRVATALGHDEVVVPLLGHSVSVSRIVEL